MADGFVANTDAAYQELLNALHVPARKVFRATLVVPPDRDELLRKSSAMDGPAQRPLFLFVGQLIERKNVAALISAAMQLHSEGHRFELWIAGTGVLRGQLERAAESLIDDGVVRFIGALPHSALGVLYQSADVFVMPSLRDYRSVAVLEAMRFGVPVIDSSKDGNSRDFVRHQRTGLVFDPHEPGALARAMERALLEPEMLREMGARAAAVLEAHRPLHAAAELRDILYRLHPAGSRVPSSHRDAR